MNVDIYTNMLKNQNMSLSEVFDKFQSCKLSSLKFSLTHSENCISVVFDEDHKPTAALILALLRMMLTDNWHNVIRQVATFGIDQ